MAKPKTVSSELVREALCKFPDTPSLTIAKKLLKDYPACFTSLNQARAAVRFHRGERKGVNICAEPLAMRDKATNAECSTSGIGIPKATPNPFKIHSLPDDVKLWLVAGDIHIPFHDEAALTLMFEYAKNIGVDGVIFLGDLIDCYQLSKFSKDPRQRRFKEEIQMTQDFLKYTKQALKPKRIIYKIGNHEERYDHYLMLKAPEIFDIPGCSLPEILGLDDLGVEVVPSRDWIKHYKLNILHGHEPRAGMISPVNPARGMFLKTIACTLSAHLHRTSHHNEPTLDDVNISAWSVGCLCDKHPQYATINKWDSGFALIETTREWRVDLKRINKGKVA